MDTGRIGPHRGEPARTVVTGPLAPYARGWRAELAARGYAPHSITAHAQLMAHVSGWLAATGRGVDAMTDEVVREYCLARRAAGYQNRTTERAAYSVDAQLRWRDANPAGVPVYAGVMVLASAAMARRLAATIPDIEIPGWLADKVAHDKMAGVEAACQQIARLRDSGAFDGVHLVPVNRYREISAHLEALP